MEGRRIRRFGIRRGRGQQIHTQPHSLLPLRTTHRPPPLSNTVSCCYCDYKISSLNDLLFRLGRRRAGIFKAWFSIGILLWELASALHLLPGNSFSNLSSAILFGFSPFPSNSVSGLSISGAAYMLVSTLIAVSLHEFGHALAAASEGIQMEYIAIFIAVLFPGALVAFNYELLQALPGFAALRVYCAGIWHNAVCCAVCGLALFLLPLILFAFYQHGESPMVLDVPSTSPLSGYLSPGDVIISLDGVRIHSSQEWMEMATLVNILAHENLNSSSYNEGFGRVSNAKGYCVPNPVLEESKIGLIENQSSCPDYLTSFVTIPCFDTNMSVDSHPNTFEPTNCLNAKDVVKFRKCGDWVTATTNGSNCTCSQDMSCLSPIQIPGFIWIEVTYYSPYSPECLKLGRKSFADSRSSEFVDSNCGGTFVFVGDIISMASSVQLTAYQPRWASKFGIYLPNVLERLLMCTFHVSLTLALLNSLPVYFLDGESVLEETLCHFTSLSPSNRGKVLQVCLLGGTLISVLAFFRIFLNILDSPQSITGARLHRT
nr:membrane-bound transcription factor site-2 protease homolog isoform X2 [Ziziphus jujuba var. spinosa]